MDESTREEMEKAIKEIISLSESKKDPMLVIQKVSEFSEKFGVDIHGKISQKTMPGEKIPDAIKRILAELNNK